MNEKNTKRKIMPPIEVGPDRRDRPSAERTLKNKKSSRRRVIIESQKKNADLRFRRIVARRESLSAKYALTTDARAVRPYLPNQQTSDIAALRWSFAQRSYGSKRSGARTEYEENTKRKSIPPTEVGLDRRAGCRRNVH